MNEPTRPKSSARYGGASGVLVAAAALVLAGVFGASAAEALERTALGEGPRSAVAAAWGGTMFFSLVVAVWAARASGFVAAGFFAAVVAVVAALRLAHRPAFVAFVSEDGAAESATVACFLGAAVMLAAGAVSRARVKRPALAALFAVTACAFLVAAGEEASWGQRAIGFASPEWVADRNNQNEFTLHNLGSKGLSRRIDRVVYAAGFLFFGLLPAFGGRLRPLLRRWTLELPGTDLALLALIATACTSRDSLVEWHDPKAWLLLAPVAGAVLFFRAKGRERATIAVVCALGAAVAASFVFVHPARERAGELKEAIFAVACLRFAASLRTPPSDAAI